MKTNTIDNEYEYRLNIGRETLLLVRILVPKLQLNLIPVLMPLSTSTQSLARVEGLGMVGASIIGAGRAPFHAPRPRPRSCNQLGPRDINIP